MALVRQITVQLDSGILCSHLKCKDIHNKMLSEKKFMKQYVPTKIHKYIVKLVDAYVDLTT